MEKLKITFIKPIMFNKKTILKSEWLKGNMPSVKYDIDGNLLTKENVTDGHMLAKSKGGETNLSNITLETFDYNQLKGNQPFSCFFDTKNFLKYCEQFVEVDLPNFNGIKYIQGIIENAFNLLKENK